METVLLIILLILALALTGVVLLQRSEGGGLGMGGGGGVVSARGAATALSKLTWIFGIAFMAASLALTILAARNSADTSVLDRLGVPAPAEESVPLPDLGGGSLLPPTVGGSDDAGAPRAD